MSGITITADSGTQFENGAAQLNSICSLDSNTFVIAFQDNNDGNKGKVLVGTRTGTSISVSFANAATVYSNSIDVINVVAMSSTKVAVAVKDANTNQGYVVICTISGTTVTVGTAVSVGGTQSSTTPSVTALDSTNIVFTNTTAASNVHCYVGSVSGTTPTFGSVQVGTGTGGDAWTICAKLDSTHIVVACWHTPSAVGNIGCIAGTVNTGAQTITFGTLSVGGNFTGGSGLSNLNPILAVFDSTHFIVGYTYNGNGAGYTDLFLQAGEVNLTTDLITLGSAIRNSTSASTCSNYSLCTMGASNFLIAYYTTTGTQCEMRGGTLTGSTTIAFDAQGPVIVDNTTCSYTALCAFNSTDFIIGLKEG